MTRDEYLARIGGEAFLMDEVAILDLLDRVAALERLIRPIVDAALEIEAEEKGRSDGPQ